MLALVISFLVLFIITGCNAPAAAFMMVICAPFILLLWFALMYFFGK